MMLRMTAVLNAIEVHLSKPPSERNFLGQGIVPMNMG